MYDVMMLCINLVAVGLCVTVVFAVVFVVMNYLISRDIGAGDR